MILEVIKFLEFIVDLVLSLLELLNFGFDRIGIDWPHNQITQIVTASNSLASFV